MCGVHVHVFVLATGALTALRCDATVTFTTLVTTKWQALCAASENCS